MLFYSSDNNSYTNKKQRAKAKKDNHVTMYPSILSSSSSGTRCEVKPAVDGG